MWITNSDDCRDDLVIPSIYCSFIDLLNLLRYKLYNYLLVSSKVRSSHHPTVLHRSTIVDRTIVSSLSKLLTIFSLLCALQKS